VDDETMRRRLAAARTGHLATVRPDGTPHVVVCCFALALDATDTDTLWSAVDGKPKSTTQLQRLRNVAGHPAASLLVDHYDDADWDELWWVRVDGIARIVSDPAERSKAVAALQAKYDQYRSMALDGPVLALDVGRWSAWP
jgi:PPOX class probable F420-dependent enzyme